MKAKAWTTSGQITPNSVSDTFFFKKKKRHDFMPGLFFQVNGFLKYTFYSSLDVKDIYE